MTTSKHTPGPWKHSPMTEPDKMRVIEWPNRGAAQNFPMGGWWVVSDGEYGLTPVRGPFRTEQEANASAAAIAQAEGGE